MSVWDYAQVSYEKIAEFYAVDTCPFCRTKLNRLSGPELQTVSVKIWTEMSIGVCPVCGWWNAQRDVRERTGQSSVALFELGSFGVLKNLDLKDVSTPLQEVRDYLSAKYEARFEMDPRLFELTVGSVFADHGFDVEVTAYSGDGGIDVILNDNTSRIGVQVKRWKDRIEATNIHALYGALVLGGMTRGVFVTTSSFRSGAIRDAERFGALGTPIELLDAPRFFDALKISQIKMERSIDEWIAKVAPHMSMLSSNTYIEEDEFYCD